MSTKMKKGFTLIELMIVIAIIAIIAAIAIPNLMQSRIRANEATAVTTVKAYATAQVTFQVGKQGRLASNIDGTDADPSGYAPNFRNLFYGNPVGGSDDDGNVEANPVNLALISKAHADAFILTYTTTNGSPTAAGPQAAYQGYLFREPAEFEGDDATADFSFTFGQVAFPVDGASTGNNAYWVSQEGTVYGQGLAPTAKAMDGAINGMATPSSGDYKGWFGL